LPTSNPYSDFTQYLVDGTEGADVTKGVHPASIALGRASVSIKTTGGSIEDAVKIAKTKMGSSTRDIERLAQGRRMLEFRDTAGGLNIYGVNFGVADDVGTDLLSSYTDSKLSRYGLGAGYSDTVAGRYDIVPGQTFYINTADIETTGITAGSQTRSISVLRRRARYDDLGNLEYLDPIDAGEVKTWFFKTNRANAARAFGPDGSLVPISDLAQILESGAGDTIAGATKREQLDGLTEALNFMTGKDLEDAGALGGKAPIRLAGHNVGTFDTRFVTQNILELMSELGDDETSAAGNAIDRLATMRIENPFFVVDTMDSSFLEMSSQVNSMIKNLKGIGLPEEKLNDLVYTAFIDKSIRTKAEMIGQGATRVSVENLVLNSNFLELLENDGLSDSFLEAIETKGTHTSAIDVTMQSYMERYLEGGQLKIQMSEQEARQALVSIEDETLVSRAVEKLTDEGHIRSRAYSPFERFMRRKVSSSSAITLTTNVQDVSALSPENFQFLSRTTEGQNKIALSVDAQILSDRFGIGGLEENFEGTLRYSPSSKRFEITGHMNPAIGSESDARFQAAARTFVQETLENARNGSKENVVLRAADTSRGLAEGTISTNVSNDLINNIQISNLAASQTDEMIAAKGRAIGNIGRVVDPTGEAINLTANTYGTGKGAVDGINPTVRPVLYGDLLEDGTERVVRYGEKVSELGLPFATIDPRSRVMAVQTSAATADIGRQIFQAEALSATASAEQKASYAAAAKAIDRTSEYGLTYFMGQGKIPSAVHVSEPETYSRLVIDKVADRNSRLIVPYDIFRELEVQVPDSSSTTGSRMVKIASQEYAEMGKHHVNFSFPQLSSTDESIVNLVFHHHFSEGEKGIQEAMDLVGQINERVIPLRTGGAGVKAPKTPHKQLIERIASDTGITLDDTEIVNLVQREQTDVIKASLGGRYDRVHSAYQNILREQAESLIDQSSGGIISLANQNEAANALKSTIEVLAEEMSDTTDSMLQESRAQIAFFGEEGVAITPMVNTQADLASEQILQSTLSRGAITSEGVDEVADMGQRVALRGQEALSGMLDIAPVLADDSSELVKDAAVQTARQLGNEGDAIAMTAKHFYQKNRVALFAGAVAVGGAAAFAKHKNRKDQQDLYDESRQMQAPQEEQRRFGIREALLNNRSNKSTLDPLATAGVVGNLDRNKIGHHSMDPNKNRHLFQG
jgi:hypothetical protein